MSHHDEDDEDVKAHEARDWELIQSGSENYPGAKAIDPFCREFELVRDKVVFHE